jgi:choloylglycine hydrolase
LDNFNLPQGPGAAECAGESTSDDLMRSSTIWTTAWNLTDLKLNYHTQHNRRVRILDLRKKDFSAMGDQIVHITLDKTREQDVEEILPPALMI